MVLQKPSGILLSMTSNILEDNAAPGFMAAGWKACFRLIKESNGFCPAGDDSRVNCRGFLSLR